MKTLLIILLMAVSPLARAAAYETPEAAADERADDVESDLYGDGTDAIDDGEWQHAIDIFRKVVAMNGKRADGALYWLAYAQNKAGRGGEALQTLAALQRSHPKSKWVGDAKALEIDIRQSSGEKIDPGKVNDEELKLIAIQGLLSSDPERAVPLLQKLVDGPYSHRVKEQALFVLSQSPSQRAAQVIASIARGSAHPELQSEAIKYLGISGRRNVALLGEVYQSASAEVKKEILRAYMVAGARAQLYAAAKSEKDPHLRTEAIRQLGVLGAGRELQEMYRAESSPEVKKTIIQSMFVGGSADVLLDIARNESDQTLRATAVRTLGLIGRERTGATLVSIYQSDADEKVRRAALDGLFVQSNAHALVELAKQEKDPKWKRDIVRKLSVMGSKEATDYLTTLLE
jgi:HEAT repeat protein